MWTDFNIILPLHFFVFVGVFPFIIYDIDFIFGNFERISVQYHCSSTIHCNNVFEVTHVCKAVK